MLMQNLAFTVPSQGFRTAANYHSRGEGRWQYLDFEKALEATPATW